MESMTRAEDVSGELQLVSFSLGEEEYGINILKVREIDRMMEITRTPEAPPFVEGVVNLRGKVIPIVDLRGRFGLEGKAHDKNTRIIMVELAGNVVGFIVDAVREVLRIKRELTEPPPTLSSGAQEQYITGIAKLDDRLLILLDLEKAVEQGDLAELPEAA